MITVIIGFLLNIFSDKLGWFGRLPGDIQLGSKNVRFYFPITTLIIINLVLSTNASVAPASIVS